MIALKNVSFAYDERPILKNISFRVDPKESLVIMGPSGSGKSTVLRLLLGLEQACEGEIIIDGQNICALKESKRRMLRRKIGMVFQDGALFDSMTAGENVGYYLLEHTDLTPQQVEDRVKEMLGFVGLDSGEVLNALPDQLSGGMQRRVAIGRALLSAEPQIMLFDEPTTGLDPPATEKVLDLIRKLQEEKPIATIVVTHQIVDAISIAERFIVIVAGELIFDGNLDELRDSQDERVNHFLRPFRESFEKVNRRQFVRKEP